MVEEKLNNKERGKYHIVLDEETFRLLTVDCKREYIKHHPEEDGRNITNRHITKQVSLHYVKSP